MKKIQFYHNQWDILFFYGDFHQVLDLLLINEFHYTLEPITSTTTVGRIR